MFCSPAIWVWASAIWRALKRPPSSSCFLVISPWVSEIFPSSSFSWALMKAWRFWVSLFWPEGLSAISWLTSSFATAWARTGSVSVTVISTNCVLGTARALYSGSQVSPRAAIVAWRTLARLTMSA